jgi:hypothetical protein
MLLLIVCYSKMVAIAGLISIFVMYNPIDLNTSKYIN